MKTEERSVERVQGFGSTNDDILIVVVLSGIEILFQGSYSYPGRIDRRPPYVLSEPCVDSIVRCSVNGNF